VTENNLEFTTIPLTTCESILKSFNLKIMLYFDDHFNYFSIDLKTSLTEIITIIYPIQTEVCPGSGLYPEHSSSQPLFHQRGICLIDENFYV